MERAHGGHHEWEESMGWDGECRSGWRSHGTICYEQNGEWVLGIMKNGKGSGPTGIVKEHLAASPHGKQVILQITNEILDGKDMSYDWRKSPVVPIYKKGSVMDLASYGGVKLQELYGFLLWKRWISYQPNRLGYWILSFHLQKVLRAWVFSWIDLSMNSHINKMMEVGFSALKQIRSIKKCLSYESLKTLAIALILSRIDHCNTLLTKFQFNQFIYPQVQNVW